MAESDVNHLALTALEAQHGHRRALARRAGVEISDLATALAKLLDSDRLAELTLIRRIESLAGVVISAADEESTNLEELEETLNHG
jgi:multidrug efflux pump subunit AcrB